MHLLVDGVAVEQRLNVDFSQLPHQFTGSCIHWDCANCIDYADFERVKARLDKECIKAEGYHLAKEVEVWCIGLNCSVATTLFPVALIPTCKKDFDTGELTRTIKLVQV